MRRPCTFKANFVIPMVISYGVEWGRESEAADRDGAVLARLFSNLRLTLTLLLE